MSSLPAPTTPAAPEYPFPIVLEPVPVPTGCFPIEIVQFWRGEYSPGHPHPLHWSIFVRTTSQRGNTHEIVGDMDTYATQDRFDVPAYHTGGDWRGAHVIGYVSPDRMNDLMNHIALVPVMRHRMSWNCQNWVYEVLKGLNKPAQMYTDASMTFGALQTHMMCLLDAWEMGEI